MRISIISIMHTTTTKENPHAKTTVAQLLHRGLYSRSHHNIALWTATDTISWGQLRQEIERIGATLRRAGYQPGDRIAVFMNNDSHSLTAAAAVLLNEYCLLPLSPAAPSHVTRENLTDRQPNAVIISPEWISLAKDLEMEGITVISTSHETYHQRHSTFSHHHSFDNRIELPTSGTTGKPKILSLQDGQILAALHASGLNGIPTHSGTTVIAHPTYHIAGLWSLISAWCAGRSLHALPRFDPLTWSAAIARHQARAAFVVPTALQDVLDSPVDTAALSSLAVITTGGAACPPHVAQEITDRFGVPVLSTYGATEFAGAVIGWDRHLYSVWGSTKTGSVGRALPGVDVQVVDSDGTRITGRRVGSLQIKSAQTGRPTQWVTTSDLASMDDDGFVWIEGRADGVIIRGGFCVQPEKVENALRNHPDVRDAAVTGRDDNRLGQVPVGVVELHSSSSPLTEADLISHCREWLHPYEVPVRLVQAPVPRSDAGKVVPAELNALVKVPHDVTAP